MFLVIVQIEMGDMNQRIMHITNHGITEYSVPIYEVVNKIKEIGEINVNVLGNKDFIEPIVSELKEAGFNVLEGNE